MSDESVNPMMGLEVQTCAMCVYYVPINRDEETGNETGECRRYPPDTLLNGFIAEEHEREDVSPSLVSGAGVPRLRNRYFWTLRADLATSYRVVNPTLWCGEFRRDPAYAVKGENDEPSYD